MTDGRGRILTFGDSPGPSRAATGVVLALQAAVLCVPPLRGLFGTAPLSPVQVMATLAGGLSVLLVIEAAKLPGRRGSRATA